MDKPTVNPPSLDDSFLQWGCRRWGCRKRKQRCYEVQVRPHPNTYVEKKSVIRAYRHFVRAEKETTSPPSEEEHLLHKQGKSKESVLIPSKQKPCRNQLKIKSKESVLIPTEHKLCHNQVNIISVYTSGDRQMSMPFKDNTTSYKKNFGSCPDKSARLHPLSNGVCTRSNNIDETDKISADGATIQDKVTDLETFVWPKFHLTLSHSEKEEDFQAIKSARLPLRPKKRTKLVQKTIHAVSPGIWLSDLSQDRYQVREKKSMKKRTKGLKAMQSVDSDLE